MQRGISSSLLALFGFLAIGAATAVAFLLGAPQEKIALTAAPSAVPTPSPSPQPEVIRTIQDYDRAYARWLAQGVTEYEISVFSIGMSGYDTVTLHVSNNGNNVEIIAHQGYGLAEPTPKAESVKDSTVEGLFAQVHDMLTANPVSTETIPGHSDLVLHSRHIIGSDPTYGYPSSNYSYVEEETEYTRMDVTGFKVIKRAAKSGR